MIAEVAQLVAIGTWHVILDYHLQIHMKWGAVKHRDWKAFGLHIGSYTAGMSAVGFLLAGPIGIAWGVGNGVWHGLVDAVTSRLSMRCRSYEGRVVIHGWDQAFHWVPLLGSWVLIS